MNNLSTKANADIATRLSRHVEELRACRRCVAMHKPVVSGGPIVSDVLLLGQAPGDKEPIMQKPWAWTAGKTLFKWFHEAIGLEEAELRKRIYIAAVCRCFPGKKETGGDRVPSYEEVSNCSTWLNAEIEILRPRLVIAVGSLAIHQFLAFEKLEHVIGKQYRIRAELLPTGKPPALRVEFDLVPLPHPSGASTWHRRSPGKELLARGMNLIAKHPAFADPSLSGTIQLNRR